MNEKNDPQQDRRDEPNDHDDLADALGALASRDESADPSDDAEPTMSDEVDEQGDEPGVFVADTEEGDESDGDDEPEPVSVFGEEIESTGPRDRRQIGAGPKKFVPSDIHYLGVKLSYVVGILLLVPALWSVAALLKEFGVIEANVPMTGTGGAKAMAFAMLLCWPFAIALLGGAYWFGGVLRKYELAAEQRQNAGQ